MVMNVLKAIWKFLEEWGEIRYQFHKKHNFKAWY